MENMCTNCGFYKTPPLFWGGSTEPLLCDCPKERSYSEEEVLPLLEMLQKCKEYFLLQTSLKSEERADAIAQLIETFKKK